MKTSLSSIILLTGMLLFGLSSMAFTTPDPRKELLSAFVNGKKLDGDADSLAISSKGLLSIQYRGKTTTSFRIVIRHRSFAGNVLLFPWDEQYNPENRNEDIDLPKMLNRMRPGDQFVIVPNDPLLGGMLVVTVNGGGC